MYQSFAMEAQADATSRCKIIVFFLVRMSLEEGGVIRANMGVSPLPISALCFEMIPDQEGVTISPF